MDFLSISFLSISTIFILPKLFSEEQSYEANDEIVDKNDKVENESDQLFDQDLNEEEDFEIPAFLRKQKF